MLSKFEHIGIAVKDLKQSMDLYEKLTGKKCYKIEEVESEGVITAFIQLGETKLELLQATSENTSIAKFIEKKGEGIHHVAFEVDDIQEETKRLSNDGFQFIYPSARNGADNKIVNFIHPKYCGGVLTELCQEKKK